MTGHFSFPFAFTTPFAPLAHFIVQLFDSCASVPSAPSLFYLCCVDRPTLVIECTPTRKTQWMTYLMAAICAAR
jgi:hypothetical protein